MSTISSAQQRFEQFLLKTRHAIQQASSEASLVQQLCHGMDELLQGALPLEAPPIAPGQYEGRLIFEDPQTGYIAVLMAWGPGAVTSIHDHGTWGVFGVCQGALEFTNFMQVSGQHVRPVAQVLAHPGDVSYVIPPEQEIHRIENPTPSPAYSIHLYGRNIGF
ncbi:MAG: hypothetical protein ACKO6N_01725 [Myxococcota bacterium]